VFRRAADWNGKAVVIVGRLLQLGINSASLQHRYFSEITKQNRRSAIQPRTLSAMAAPKGLRGPDFFMLGLASFWPQWRIQREIGPDG